MKIVVLGKGFLGQEFEKRGYEVLGKDKVYFDRNDTFSSSATFRKIYDKLHKYDVVINCIGKSNTRWCENNFQGAYFSNVFIPEALSHFCNGERIKFVHISTGCLYDRNDVPQKETDFLAAHCQYTLTKWLAEIKLNPNDLIIRPRLYFADYYNDNNLCVKINKFDRMMFEDNSYTSTHIIVSAIEALLQNDQTGIFNVACEGTSTMIDLAHSVGIEKQMITRDELHKEQGLYLVDNVMDISKLKQFYQPPHILDEWKRCYESVNGSN